LRALTGMSETISKRLRILRAARFAWAVILLFGIQLSVLPFRAMATASSCARACCAKRKSRAAGSCQSGSCHRAARAKRPRANDPSADRKQSLAAFTRTCPPDCSAGTLSTRTQNNFAATVRIASDGSGSAQRTTVARNRVSFGEILLSQSAPRGPPVFFS
jgi:hypothetical protein